METKKNFNANLEKKRTLFFQTGLIIALGLSLIALEWNSEPSEIVIFEGGESFSGTEELTKITFREEPKLKKPPVPEPSALILVEDNHIIDDNPLDITDSEIGENTKVEIYQMPDEEAEDDIPFISVQNMPEFRNGGLEKFKKYVYEQIQYPQTAIEYGIQGKVIVRFVIDETGQVTGIDVLRGADPLLDKEAVRVISSSPAWKPGKQMNKRVKVQFVMPIDFKLNG
jgi:protein TonB